MDAQEITRARETLGKLADMAAAAFDDGSRTGDMALHLRIAQLYLAEYAAHLAGGKSPDEALRATARPAPRRME